MELIGQQEKQQLQEHFQQLKQNAINQVNLVFESRIKSLLEDIKLANELRQKYLEIANKCTIDDCEEVEDLQLFHLKITVYCLDDNMRLLSGEIPDCASFFRSPLNEMSLEELLENLGHDTLEDFEESSY